MPHSPYSIYLLISFLLICSGCSDEPKHTIATNEKPIQPPLPVHVDPLDEGRGGSTHRGKNPHAKLTTEQHIKVALQHHAEGRLPQALAVLNQAISKSPDTSELYDVRANILLQNNKAAEALADIEKAIKLNPDNPLYLVNRSQIYLKFERDKDAMVDLNKAIELQPELIPARFNRGTLLVYQEKSQQAIADFEHCIALAPHLPGPYFNRGSAYRLLGEKAKAVADIKRFIQIAKRETWKKAGKDLLKAWKDEDEKSANTKANQ